MYPERVVIATDGGVVILYLGDKWNPVLTKRLGGLDMEETMTDQEGAEKLIEMMKKAKDKDRWMTWWEVIVIMKNTKVLYKTKIKGGEGCLMKRYLKDSKKAVFG